MSDSARELIGLGGDVEGRRVERPRRRSRGAWPHRRRRRDPRPGGGARRPGARRQPQPRPRARTSRRDRDHPARPHRAARPPERAQRTRVDHEHAARADPRVPQPAPHHLRPGAARGVRRGVTAGGHVEPPSCGDLRRRPRPRRGPRCRGAPDRQDQPGRRAGRRPGDRRRQRPAAPGPRVVDRRRHGARQPRGQRGRRVGVGRRDHGRGRTPARRRHGPPGRGDTGPGVPADQVGEIFRRGWSSKEPTVGGRGVGLALVQVVCERRGGAVTVRAGDDGTGAVFEADLPGVVPGVEVG